MAARILVGTASWADPGFVEYWYPPKMRAGDRLACYARHFDLVEVNSTFYSAPAATLAKRWAEQTPDGFVFDVKLHQLLSRHSTPAKLLPSPMRARVQSDARGRSLLSADAEEEMVTAFRPALELLRRAGKLGVLLLQLSPSFSPQKHSLAELDHLLRLLAGYRVAIELRNRHWTAKEKFADTISFFREKDAIFVNVDAPRAEHFTIMPSDLDAITNPNVSYLRLHGRNAKGYLTGKTVAARFDYDYTDSEIDEVAQRAEKLARKAREVHIIFNNNARDYAPHAALRLRRALGQLLTRPQTGELF